jgi:hypothetical protein
LGLTGSGESQCHNASAACTRQHAHSLAETPPSPRRPQSAAEDASYKLDKAGAEVEHDAKKAKHSAER